MQVEGRMTSNKTPYLEYTRLGEHFLLLTPSILEARRRVRHSAHCVSAILASDGAAIEFPEEPMPLKPRDAVGRNDVCNDMYT